MVPNPNPNLNLNPNAFRSQPGGGRRCRCLTFPVPCHCRSRWETLWEPLRGRGVHCGPHATVFAIRWEFASSNEFGNYLWPQWGLLPGAHWETVNRNSCWLSQFTASTHCTPLHYVGQLKFAVSSGFRLFRELQLQSRTGSKSTLTCMTLRIRMCECECVTRKTAIKGPGEIPEQLEDVHKILENPRKLFAIPTFRIGS